MEQSHWLLVSLLLALPACLCLPGKGEKLRINPDDVDRVVQLSNLTRRDPTAKNVNFAWRMTVRSTLATTQDPAHTSTLDAEMSKRNNEIYDKLFAQLAYTLRDKVYLDRWLTEMDKGYHIFLYEIQKQDRHRFIKHRPGDNVFSGEAGVDMWQHMTNYMKYLGSRDKFLDFVIEGLGVEPAHVTMTTEATTMPDLPPELEKSVLFIYRQLVPTFRNATYRRRWLESNKKGYDIFIKELEGRGPAHFLYVRPNDTDLMGAQGALMWEAIVKLFACLRQTGFEDFLHKVDHLPDKFEASDLLRRGGPASQTRITIEHALPPKTSSPNN